MRGFNRKGFLVVLFTLSISLLFYTICVEKCKKKKPPKHIHLCIVCVFGGFFFHFTTTHGAPGAILLRSVSAYRVPLLAVDLCGFWGGWELVVKKKPEIL